MAKSEKRDLGIVVTRTWATNSIMGWLAKNYLDLSEGGDLLAPLKDVGRIIINWIKPLTELDQKMMDAALADLQGVRKFLKKEGRPDLEIVVRKRPLPAF